MPIDRFIAYYRVSTVRQGRSGLGLEAQREAVCRYLRDPQNLLAGSYVEVESGTRADRPQLRLALAACRLHRARLVIAKLDRLARSVAFVSNLMESGVEFQACDFPQANRLTIHILAAVAEHEAKMISERTQAALAAAKTRGAVLGGFRGRIATDSDREKGRSTRSRNADLFAADLAPTINAMGFSASSSAVACKLNEMGVTTRRGLKWSPTQAQRLMVRIAKLDTNYLLQNKQW
nr:recombinase family protein [Methylopila sp. Yamaguchi]